MLRTKTWGIVYIIAEIDVRLHHHHLLGFLYLRKLLKDRRLKIIKLLRQRRRRTLVHSRTLLASVDLTVEGMWRFLFQLHLVPLN